MSGPNPADPANDATPDDVDVAGAEFERAQALFEHAQGLSDEAREACLREAARMEPSAVMELVRHMLRCWTGENAFERPLADLGGMVREVCATSGRHPVDGTADDPPRRLPNFGERFSAVAYLGRGGVGEVYRGEQIAPLSRTVALKLLPWSHLSDSETRRFEREALVLARLRHPGVVRVYEAGATPDGRLFIVMEFVDGTPLDQWNLEARPDSMTRMRIFRELCATVAYAHQHNVVHRDLKPQNILLERGATGELAVRVIDFGIAKLTDDDAPAPYDVTRTGQVIGTLDYMSPEQRAGMRDADTRMDVYALGAVLYLLATGRVLHRDRTEEEARDDAPVVLREAASVPRAWRRDLAAIVRKATAHHAEDRYAGAGELADDVQRMVELRPLSARPAGTTERVLRLVRRRPRTSALVAALTAIAALAIGALVQSRTALARSVEQLSAEQREQTTLTLELIDRVLDDLSVVVGTTEARRALTDQLLQRTRSLLALSPNDDALLEAEARIMRALGEIELSEGRIDAAMPWREGARDRFSGLLAKRPDDIELARRYAESIVLIGDLHHESGDTDAARVEWRRAFEHHRAFADRWPDHLGVLDDLTWSYDRLWSNAWAERDPESLLALMEERVALARCLIALDPSRALSRLSLMEGHYRVAITLDRMGSDRGAEEWSAISEAVRIGEELVALDPHRLQYRVTLAQCLQHASHVASVRGMRKEQRQIADRLEALAAAIDRDDPDHRQAAGIRIRSLAARALVLRDEGALDAARAKVREMLAEFAAIERRTGALDRGAESSRQSWQQWLNGVSETRHQGGG